MIGVRVERVQHYRDVTYQPAFILIDRESLRFRFSRYFEAPLH